MQAAKLIAAALIGAVAVYLAGALIAWEWWSPPAAGVVERAFALMFWPVASLAAYAGME